MAITIDAKPFEVKAELPGYGIFYLRHLGAGKEAELQDMMQKAKAEIDAVAEQYKDITEKEEELVKADDKTSLEELRASTEYKAAQKAQQKAGDSLQSAVAYANKCQLSLWRSDDKKALERLFSDFTAEQIRGFYAQVMLEAEGADA